MFGEPDPACSRDILKVLKRLPNVRLQGRYDSFDALARRGHHSMLLYTSRYDGLPNVLLEASAAGLPIVAADVGGIAEFLHGKTGYLVRSDAKAGEFVAAIKSLLGNPAEAERRAARARELLLHRHSWSAFKQAARAVPGYLHEGVERPATVHDAAPDQASSQRDDA
ncbi:Capsular glucan synthase [compost metagenome]